MYFQVTAGGYYYLYQLLSVRDLNSADFDNPYPHRKNPHNPIVLEAINLTFGWIMLAHSQTVHYWQSVLSLLLDSMVHHSDWSMGVIQKYPEHPFDIGQEF